jgi:DNA-binding XRE family transcriptional regulator
MTITGKSMKKIRKWLGITQEEMAKKMGYKNRETINRKENGKDPITARDIKFLEKYYE